MAKIEPVYVDFEGSDADSEASIHAIRLHRMKTTFKAGQIQTKKVSRVSVRDALRNTIHGAILAIASQGTQLFAQNASVDPPQWRSRSEMQAKDYERIADRNGVGRASLGRPVGMDTNPSRDVDRSIGMPASASVGGYQANYRDVPNSPWERPAPTASQRTEAFRYGANSGDAYDRRPSERNDAGKPESNMIRQPLPSRTIAPSSGLPERYQDIDSGTRGNGQNYRRQSENPYQGGPMTMDLSAYKKPSGTTFISQPPASYPSGNLSATTSNRGQYQESIPARTERLPYGGVAISSELDETPVGLGYPEMIRSSADELDRTRSYTHPNSIRESMERESSGNMDATSSPSQSNLNSVPREAVREVPVPSDALRKAAQINERSQDREKSRVRYAQQKSLDQASTQSMNNNLDSQFESESTTRSNVVGVIPRDTISPYSTASSVSMNNPRVVAASVALNSQVPQNLVPQVSLSAEALQGQTRIRTASRVSAELLDGSQAPLAQAPLPLEPPVGWKSIEETLKAHISKCDDLLRRGAVLSAREEVLMGMRSLFRAIDLRSGTWTSEPAMDQAIAAFTEEADFFQSNASTGNRLTTDRIVSGHATRALKQTQLHQVSPDLAAQHYRSYAKQQWLEAAQGHPWTADLLYAYGKTLEREADQNPQEAQMRRSQAVICYQAAMEIHPQNADNANQLGYALLQLDRVDEAQLALNHSIRINPNPQAWNNLVEVYRRRGEADQVAFAQRNVQQIKQSVAPEEVGVPEVIEVDAKTFASVSPYPTGMQSPGQLPPTGQPAVQSASATIPVSKPSWFGKFFR